MTNMTLAVPHDLKSVMERHKEVKWSEVARQALWNHARRLEIMDKIASKSGLTEADAFEIGKKIKKAVAAKHGF